MGFISAWRERRALKRNNIQCSEGHLGGYIAASAEAAPSGLQIEHGDPQTYTPELWRWAVEKLAARSVLDIGCGEGHASLYFRELGCEVLAVDGSQLAHQNSVVPDVHLVHDFVKGPLLPEREFDLAWCCEFVEHVEERYSENFLLAFEAARFVMLTHAKPGQVGWHHVNCQTAEYWIARMDEHGFDYDEAMSQESRAQSTGRHYRRRGLFFRRRERRQA